MVVPVRDRPQALARLLDRLGGLEVVVVDDGSLLPGPVERVARDAGARYVALPANRGPAAARNAGCRHVPTELVAFVDSDCLPDAGWLEPLLAQLSDPAVGLVAPRVVAAEGRRWLDRYEQARAPLDRGPTPGRVHPGSRIPFLPGAALLARRSAMADPCFDPDLRTGEDVDLAWRAAAAGWDVRYVPTARVVHDRHDGPGHWLIRRAQYGASAGLLARRHRQALAPARTSIWTAATWTALAVRRPVLAALSVGAPAAVLARRLRGRVERPATVAIRIVAGGVVRAALPTASGLARAWAPAVLAGLGHRRTRRLAVAALALPAISDWWTTKPDLDLPRYLAAHVADDLAYGAGVWVGCARARTAAPLLPTLAWRRRTGPGTTGPRRPRGPG